MFGQTVETEGEESIPASQQPSVSRPPARVVPAAQQLRHPVKPLECKEVKAPSAWSLTV
jgi:hypothetical protein